MAALPRTSARRLVTPARVGHVPVAARAAWCGMEARVRDAAAAMRCGNCGARRIQIRWLDRRKPERTGGTRIPASVAAGP